MVSIERYSNLPEYAFPRLRALLSAHEPGGELISMSLGEPRHPFPPLVTQAVNDNAQSFNDYPANEGTPELLAAIAGWIGRRYGVQIANDRCMPLNGSKEGLFNAALALCPETKGGKRPVVLIPNPYYPVYAVGAVTLGAEPVFVPATAETGFLPDFCALPAEVLDRTAIAYICSPSNPQGAIASLDYWRDLIALAERHDFRIFADECYSELYRDAAPPGAIEAATGADPEKILVFNSLSKRSNLPGLRSGFVAGGPQALAVIRRLRSYSGAQLPGPIQAASAKVWADEGHVDENRALYRAKYDLADRILGEVPGYRSPHAGFFLWLDIGDGEAATLKLWRETGVRVLPGAYLAQTIDGTNPGAAYIRIAMVAPFDQLESGLSKIRDCLYG